MKTKAKSNSRVTTAGTTVRLSPFVREVLRKKYGSMSPNEAIALLLEQNAPIDGATLLEITNGLTRRIPLSEFAAAIGEIGYDCFYTVSAERGEIAIRAAKK